MVRLEVSSFEELQRHTGYEVQLRELPFGLGISHAEFTSRREDLFGRGANFVARALSAFELPGSEYTVEVSGIRIGTEDGMYPRFAHQGYRILNDGNVKEFFPSGEGYVVGISSQNVPEYSKNDELSQLLANSAEGLIGRTCDFVREHPVEGIGLVRGSIVARTADRFQFEIPFSHHYHEGFGFHAPKYSLSGQRLLGFGPTRPISTEEFAQFSSLMRQSLRNLLFKD